MKRIKILLIAFLILILYSLMCIIPSNQITPNTSVPKNEIIDILPKSSTITAITTKTDFWYDGGYAYGVDVVEGFAYVADGHDGLEIISISDPYNINEVGGYYDGSGEAMNVLIWKDIAYVVEKWTSPPPLGHL